jgi:hypothetical protein
MFLLINVSNGGTRRESAYVCVVSILVIFPVPLESSRTCRRLLFKRILCLYRVSISLPHRDRILGRSWLTRCEPMIYSVLNCVWLVEPRPPTLPLGKFLVEEIREFVNELVLCFCLNPNPCFKGCFLSLALFLQVQST